LVGIDSYAPLIEARGLRGVPAEKRNGFADKLRVPKLNTNTTVSFNTVEGTDTDSFAEVGQGSVGRFLFGGGLRC